MSVAYTLTVTGSDKLNASLAKFGASAGLSRELGRAGVAAVKEHFFRLDGERANPMGGKRSHFYWNAGASAEASPIEGGTKITVTKTGLRQRWFGGTIRAINCKYLTIPARAESYGVRARDMGDLTFIPTKRGGMLVKDEQTHTVDMDSGGHRIRSAAKGQRKSRKKGIGLVMYWLVPSVYQKPDPSVIPSPEFMLGAVTPALERYMGGFNV